MTKKPKTEAEHEYYDVLYNDANALFSGHKIGTPEAYFQYDKAQDKVFLYKQGEEPQSFASVSELYSAAAEYITDGEPDDSVPPELVRVTGTVRTDTGRVTNREPAVRLTFVGVVHTPSQPEPGRHFLDQDGNHVYYTASVPIDQVQTWKASRSQNAIRASLLSSEDEDAAWAKLASAVGAKAESKPVQTEAAPISDLLNNLSPEDAAAIEDKWGMSLDDILADISDAQMAQSQRWLDALEAGKKLRFSEDDVVYHYDPATARYFVTYGAGGAYDGSHTLGEPEEISPAQLAADLLGIHVDVGTFQIEEAVLSEGGFEELRAPDEQELAYMNVEKPTSGDILMAYGGEPDAPHILALGLDEDGKIRVGVDTIEGSDHVRQFPDTAEGYQQALAYAKQLQRMRPKNEAVDPGKFYVVTDGGSYWGGDSNSFDSEEAARAWVDQHNAAVKSGEKQDYLIDLSADGTDRIVQGSALGESAGNEQVGAAVAAWLSVVDDYSFGKPTEAECKAADAALKSALQAQGVLTDKDKVKYFDATETGLKAVLTGGRVIHISSNGSVGAQSEAVDADGEDDVSADAVVHKIAKTYGVSFRAAHAIFAGGSSPDMAAALDSLVDQGFDDAATSYGENEAFFTKADVSKAEYQALVQASL